eukprot:6180211-Pleurochrysis_carterae.AAC.1
MDTHGAQAAEQGVEADTILHRKQGCRRRSEPERKAVTRTSNGSMCTAVSKGAMAACARLKCAGARVRMADECPGATASPARLSDSGADEEAAEADLLASASRRALSARRRMTVVGESKACTIGRPLGQSAGPAPALARTGGTGWRHAKAGRKCLGGIPRERRRQCRRRWDAGWCARWSSDRGDQRDAPERRAPRPGRSAPSRLLQATAAGSPGAGRPALRRADGAAAIE